MNELLRWLGPAAAPPTLVRAVLSGTGLIDRYVERRGPVGPVFVAFNRAGVSACALASEEGGEGFERWFEARFGRPAVPDTAPPPRLLARLDSALAGRRAALRFDLGPVSGFGRDVLAKTAEIPAGQVRSYGWVAAEIGRPGAHRAVGTALGANPVPLLIPCHRVVRADGRVGDYALGPPVKRAVLAAEGADPAALEALAGRGVRFVASATTGVFCHPSCARARRIGARHRVELRSLAQAATGAYRPCRLCRPDPGRRP